jgi:hypothetical protein
VSAHEVRGDSAKIEPPAPPPRPDRYQPRDLRGRGRGEQTNGVLRHRRGGGRHPQNPNEQFLVEHRESTGDSRVGRKDPRDRRHDQSAEDEQRVFLELRQRSATIHLQVDCVTDEGLEVHDRRGGQPRGRKTFRFLLPTVGPGSGVQVFLHESATKESRIGASSGDSQQLERCAGKRKRTDRCGAAASGFCQKTAWINLY